MPRKTKQTGYETRIPEHVQLWTIDVLEHLAGQTADLTTKDIAVHFGISINNAYVRLTRLRSWGMVRIEKRTRPKTYVITPWGKKFLEDKRKE